MQKKPLNIFLFILVSFLTSQTVHATPCGDILGVVMLPSDSLSKKNIDDSQNEFKPNLKDADSTLLAELQGFVCGSVIYPNIHACELEEINCEGIDDDLLNEKTLIPVCWENPSKNYSYEMELVKKTLKQSWSNYALVEFVGWSACEKLSEEEKAQSVHILISDAKPTTKALGTNLLGLESGIVLNFDFENWYSNFCHISNEQREKCITGTTVHEFGHVLGLAHEQNREDTPEKCEASIQGDDGNLCFGEWDEDSVMNYCNEEWYEGQLSEIDILTISKLYGEKENVKNISNSSVILKDYDLCLAREGQSSIETETNAENTVNNVSSAGGCYLSYNKVNFLSMMGLFLSFFSLSLFFKSKVSD